MPSVFCNRANLLSAAAGMALLGAGGLSSCASPSPEAATDPADLLFVNARVYTVEPDQPWAEAVAVDDGRIVAVGTQADIARYAGTGTETVDLGGRLLMPSFGDAHVHPVFGGMAYTRCSLHEGETLEDYQEIIAGCIADRPAGEPVYGVGWEDSLFPPNGIPRKEVLDEVSTDRPLVFESVGGHSYWVNSKTLELAGIDSETPDPENGHINRDPETGEPVGGLQESAMELVSDFVAAPGSAEMQESILYVAKEFNRLGITNWHDAGIDLGPDGTSKTLEAYQAVMESGSLTSHVSLAFKWENGGSLEQIPVILEASERAREAGITAKSVKLYEDGVIPQRTAAMIEPYAGDTDFRGKLQIPPETLTQAVTELTAHGMQPHVHAIGDRATRTALDAFEAAVVANGSAQRPMISHLNVIDPADQPRFGELGVIAVFQPTWTANYLYMDLTKKAIGPERSQYIYPAGSVLEGGGILAYGADWPVATADPLLGLQVATTRVNYEQPDSAPLLPDEAVSLEEAVKAHTLNVAYTNWNEDVTGSIKAGKSADLIVLDKNIFEMPLMEISQASVILTLFEGEAVYGELDQFSDVSTE
ncbi:amidohydrolase [Henriciella aquimarina]|uniref:amidohydrolase n=1 Tax=Henriciella aquimarina TaxID=545261 RepID=UPI0009FE386A|nr:amidohydrolase [Henriciella aquimarina]